MFQLNRIRISNPPVGILFNQEEKVRVFWRCLIPLIPFNFFPNCPAYHKNVNDYIAKEIAHIPCLLPGGLVNSFHVDRVFLPLQRGFVTLFQFLFIYDLFNPSPDDSDVSFYPENIPPVFKFCLRGENDVIFNNSDVFIFFGHLGEALISHGADPGIVFDRDVLGVMSR